jgi:hypothetical protein
MDGYRVNLISDGNSLWKKKGRAHKVSLYYYPFAPLTYFLVGSSTFLLVALSSPLSSLVVSIYSVPCSSFPSLLGLSISLDGRDHS